MQASGRKLLIRSWAPPLPAASLRLGKDHKILMVSNESTRASNRKNMFSSLSHPHHQEASKRMSWIPKSLSTVASFHIQSETTLMIPPGTSHGRSPRRIPKGKDSKQISKIVHEHSTRASCFCFGPAQFDLDWVRVPWSPAIAAGPLGPQR